MDKLVTIGFDATGNPIQLPAQTLASRLHGLGWLSPEKLKTEYNIPDDLWKRVQSDLHEAYRDVHRESRGNDHHILNMNINEQLSQKYALALPHGASMSTLISLRDALDHDRKQEIERLLFIFVMEPTYRARLLANRYNKVEFFREFAYLIEASYFAYLRHNYAAAFMTIIPVIEGVILRWAATKDPKWAQQKMKFWEMHAFVQGTPRRTPLLSVPLFADIWAATCASILKDNFYKDTKSGPSVSNFNRHLALHMIEDKEFCTPFNIARTFLLLDLLGSLYLAEHYQTDIIDMSTPEDILPYSSNYLSLIRGATGNIERTMSRYARYKTLMDAHDRLGDPADYWKNPLMLPFREIIKKALHFAVTKKPE